MPKSRVLIAEELSPATVEALGPDFEIINCDALAVGDREAGCSVHLVTAELDAGEVLGQARVAILPGDTPETVAARVLAAEHQLYPRILAEFVHA